MATGITTSGQSGSISTLKLSDVQQRFLAALEKHNGDSKAAAKEVGVTSLSSILTEQMKTAINSLAESMLSLSSVRAASVIVKGLEQEDSILYKETLPFAKEALDRAGITKKERAPIDIKINPVILLPPKRPLDEEHSAHTDTSQT